MRFIRPMAVLTVMILLLTFCSCGNSSVSTKDTAESQLTKYTDMPLSGVSGVYNAVEIIAEPLGNIMLYGQGAGAGATASAVVGDLMQVMRMGTGCYAPVLNKCTDIADYDGFASRFYIAADKAYSDIVLEAFPSAVVIPSESECAIITESMSERELSDRLSAIGVTPLSKIRVL